MNRVHSSVVPSTRTRAPRAAPPRGSVRATLLLAAAAATVLAAACGDVSTDDTNTTPVTGAATRSFQDGVAPSSTYAGTRDTWLRQYTPTTNYGAATTGRVDGDDPNGSGDDINGLIRWDVSSIPAGSTVRSATITLYVTNLSSGPFQIYLLNRAFDEASADWTLAATGVAWTAAGATGSSDRGSTSLGTISAPATGSVTITLNTAGIAAVQGWVNNPASNRGLTFQGATVTDGLSFVSREGATASQRPRLTVSYDPPAAMDGGASTDSGATDAASTTDSATGDATSTADATSGADAGTTDATSGSDTGTSDAGAGGPPFPAGTICNNTGVPRVRPAVVRHVIMILMENKSASAVTSSNAPYFASLQTQCGSSTQFLDNIFNSDQLSLPHYMALTSGSNCNTGLGSTSQTPGATGCITDDNDPSSHRLATTSIFNQVASWRAYQESMPSACGLTTHSPYAAKHNPPVYYSAITDCPANDLPIAAVSCPTTVNTICSAPSNAFATDIANDTLPAYAFVTPNLTNDMHDGTVAQGDNWLHTYLPRIFASAAYLRGEVAVYVMWDESSPGVPQPNLFISPYIAPTRTTTTMNLFAVLRATEDQLGIGAHLGCAGGTPPGGIGTCPAGSTVDLRSVFNF